MVLYQSLKHQNRTYIFTQKNGVYILENGVLNSWKSPLNEILKTAYINAAMFIKNNKRLGRSEGCPAIPEELSKGIINTIKNKSCLSEWCYTIPSNKYSGYCLRCYIHLFPDNPVSRNYKTKEIAVVEFITKIGRASCRERVSSPV